MYLKLKDIKLQRVDNSEDRFILAEVPDSPMSYEVPIVVRSQEELDIWFGQDFKDYNYFSELIESQVSLYLYKPVKTEEIVVPGYVDLDDYQEHNGNYANPSVLPEESDPDFDPTEKYRVGQPEIKWNELYDGGEVGSLPSNPDPNTKYKMGDAWYTYLNSSWYCSSDLPGCYYIWLWNSWVSEYDLPQNVEKSTISQNNRDTLLVPAKEYTGNIEFCHPEYKEGIGLVDVEKSYTLGEEAQIPPESENWSSVIDLEYPSSSKLPYYYYLVLPNFKNDLTEPIYFGVYFNIFDLTPEQYSDYGISEVVVDELPEEPSENTFYIIDGIKWYHEGTRWINSDEAKNEMYYLKNNPSFIVKVDPLNEGWETIKNKIIENSESTNVISTGDSIGVYSVSPFPINDYYYFPGLNLSYNDRETQNFITSNLGRENWGIEMWSKTIGRVIRTIVMILSQYRLKNLRPGIHTDLLFPVLIFLRYLRGL